MQRRTRQSSKLLFIRGGAEALRTHRWTRGAGGGEAYMVEGRLEIGPEELPLIFVEARGWAACCSGASRPHLTATTTGSGLCASPWSGWRNRGSAAGSQEDLARHVGRSQFAGALLGEAPGPAPQERGYLRELLARLVRPRDTGYLRGLRLLLRRAQDAVERVGQDARPRVAHERPLHERAVVGGRAEREERDAQRVGDALFEVRPDDEVGVRGLDAGGDLLRVVFHERLVCEGVRVEEEVSLEVPEVGAAGGDLEPYLPREGVAEPEGVGEVPKDRHPAVPERLRLAQAGVPGELRRPGQLRPHRLLHPLRVEVAQLSDRSQRRPGARGADHGRRHALRPELVLEVERRRLPDLPVEEYVDPRLREAAQVSDARPQRYSGVDPDPDQGQNALRLGVLGRGSGAEDRWPEQVDGGGRALLALPAGVRPDEILQRQVRRLDLPDARGLPVARDKPGGSPALLGEGDLRGFFPGEERCLRAGQNHGLHLGVPPDDAREVAGEISRTPRVLGLLLHGA